MGKYEVLVRCRRCGQPLGVAVWHSYTPLDVAKSLGFRCPKCLRPLPMSVEELQKVMLLKIKPRRKKLRRKGQYFHSTPEIGYIIEVGRI